MRLILGIAFLTLASSAFSQTRTVALVASEDNRFRLAVAATKSSI